MKNEYQGTCHCEKTRFRASLDLADSIVCDCSICTKKGAIINRIPDEDLEILTPIEELGLYQFNKMIAKHFFCKTCGIFPFHRPRSAPDLWGINVRCLKGVETSKLSPRQVHGSKLD